MTDIVERLLELSRNERGDPIDDAINEIKQLRADFAESQAREAKLRAALNNVAWLRHPSVRSSTLVEKLERIALDALALPHDDSALKERLKAERERLIGEIRELANACDDPVEAYGLCMAAGVIQKLGDE